MLELSVVLLIYTCIVVIYIIIIHVYKVHKNNMKTKTIHAQAIKLVINSEAPITWIHMWLATLWLP